MADTPFSIAERHARKMRSGAPMRCSLTKEEDRDMRRRGGDRKRKLIYDTWSAADTAAREIAALTGDPPLEPYLCPRSKNGHYHLTKMLHPPGKPWIVDLRKST